MVNSNDCIEKLGQVFVTIKYNWHLKKSSIRNGTPCSQMVQGLLMVKHQSCIHILDVEEYVNFSLHCDKMPGRRILKKNSFI